MVRKRYPDSPTRSAELLRLALPLMSRQKAAPHPLSYAVWYEHVAGKNRALSDAIAQLTAGGTPLDDEQTVQLYDQHVVDVDEQSAQRVAEGVRGLLDEMSDSARQAGSQTERFDASLERWNDQVTQGHAADAEALNQVVSETRQMRSSMVELKSRLASSQVEIERLRREIERARDEALIDVLTGLANRRAFETQLAQCVEGGDPGSCLIVCDIDHFKRINDSFGHLFGDQVLKVVSKALQSCLGNGHGAARVGGEEFAILLPGVGLAEGRQVADRVRATVAASRIRRRDSNETIGQVTVSLGLSALRPDDSAESWFERVDQALYASKQAGRNRVTVTAAGSPERAAPSAAASPATEATSG